MSRSFGHVSDPSPIGATGLNLKQVALLLDVHYMTAYRYVRNGQLPARRQGQIWVVDTADVEDFRRDRSSPRPRQPVDWAERLRQRLLVGDEVGAWTVITGALSAGHTSQTCHLDVLVPAVASVEADLAAGRGGVADGLLALTTASRLVARLGGTFRHRGRSKGTIICGAPPGEHRSLAVGIVANLVRLDGFTVLELGTDVPSAAFLQSTQGDDALVVVIGMSSVDRLPAAHEVVEALHAVHPDLPVLVVGPAGTQHTARFDGATTSVFEEGEALLSVRRLAVRARRPRAGS